jgi:ribonucleoside-diphosphate reductase alpha chain
MKRDPAPHQVPALPLQPISVDVLREKYLKADEGSEADLLKRVARALASVEAEPLRAEWEQRFFDNLRAGAIGAGRIMSAAGTDLQATLINCFVQPVGDAIQGVDEEGFPGIYEALREAAETMRRGGGVGYDFSRIRPRGAEVRGTGSLASGPCSYMDVFDHSCSTVESAGARRGAQMGVMRVDHPDVLEFITAKRTPGRWNNFNVSVAVTDEFIRTLQAGGDWPLVHKARPGAGLVAQGAHLRPDGLWVYKSVPAQQLWDTVMRSAYDFAEPGILFVDTINRENNLRYAEKISATNPCVTADTRLATQFGLVPIGELCARGVALEATVDRRTLATQGPGVVTRSAKPAFRTAARAPVFRVVTEDGYDIKATEWHDFYTGRGKIKLRDLLVGDELLVQSGKGQFGQEGNEDLGLLLGLLAGDGHFTNRGRGNEAAVVDLWGEERLLADRVSRFVNSLIASASASGRSYEVAPIAMPRRNRVSIRSVILARLLAEYGFTRATKLKVPEVVWRGSEDCVRGYLRGLFQTDGTVNVSSSSQSCSVRLASSHVGLLKDVQMLLSNFGVFCRIRKRREAGDRAMPDGRGGLRSYHCTGNFELIVDGESRDRFMGEVGFLLPNKNERYAAWARDKVLLKSQRFTSRVTTIESAGEEAVFDTTQPDHNSVIFNGLVTGQCGEQPLPAYGCCDLGPIILTKFVRHPFGFGGPPQFDFEGFTQAVAIQVRALDNVLDLTFWPLEQQRAEAHAKRRIGVGFTGLGNALAMLRLRYDAPEGRDMAARLGRGMRDAAYAASVELAKEKGAFPLFDAQPYLEAGTFASRLDEPLKQAIRQHGIRNSHLLSIAPTGTVSLAFADNASNGIEPPFSWTYHRKKREGDGRTTEYTVEDHAWRLFRSLGGDTTHLPPYFVSALQMPAADHLAMMESVQPFIDTAISKTVNVPADHPYEDFQGLYLEAWRAGLKGLATYRPNDILGSVLSTTPEAKAQQDPAVRPGMDPMRAVIERRPNGQLAAVAEKVEYWTQQGRQTLYIVVSFLPLEDGRERAIEFFMPVGQSGESQQWITSSMRLLSLAARGGFLDRALTDMRKVAWDRGPVRLGTYAKAEGGSVPMWHDSEVAAIAYAVQNIIARRNGEPVAALATPPNLEAMSAAPSTMAGSKCPECGAHAMIRKDGCDFCTSCGHVGACG